MEKYITDVDGTPVVSRENAALAFRNAASGVRKHNSAEASRLLNSLARQLAAVSVTLGYLTEAQIDSVLQPAQQEAQANLDADLAGEAAEAPYEPLARMFDRLADLVERKDQTDTVPQTTAQPITRAKVAARLRVIATALVPLVGSPRDGMPLVKEAVKLTRGAEAAGWINADVVDDEFRALRGLGNRDASNRGVIDAIGWLASVIENVDEQPSAQGDGATAPFTDISTEASKRAAIANELRTVREKLRAFGDDNSDSRGLAMIESEQHPLVDKAVELGFITDEEHDRIFGEAFAMSESVGSYLTAMSVVANRIEHGAAQQEKVA